MKNRYTNTFKKTLKELRQSGYSSIVDHCITCLDLGKTPKEREFNSWVYIISFFVEACYNSDSQKIHNERMQELTTYYINIPTQYREKVYRRVNADLKEKDLFFYYGPVGYPY